MCTCVFIFIFWVFLRGVVWFFEKEKEHKVGWVERGSGRSWGRRKKILKHCIKFNVKFKK